MSKATRMKKFLLELTIMELDSQLMQLGKSFEAERNQIHSSSLSRREDHVLDKPTREEGKPQRGRREQQT
jgi:hypothetical protein